MRPKARAVADGPLRRSRDPARSLRNLRPGSLDLMAGLTSDEFRAYAALAWKCGLISKDQFELLVKEHDRLTGLAFPQAIKVLEDEMRFEGQL